MCTLLMNYIAYSIRTNMTKYFFYINFGYINEFMLVPWWVWVDMNYVEILHRCKFDNFVEYVELKKQREEDTLRQKCNLRRDQNAFFVQVDRG